MPRYRIVIDVSQRVFTMVDAPTRQAARLTVYDSARGDSVPGGINNQPALGATVEIGVRRRIISVTEVP